MQLNGEQKTNIEKSEPEILDSICLTLGIKIVQSKWDTICIASRLIKSGWILTLNNNKSVA